MKMPYGKWFHIGDAVCITEPVPHVPLEAVGQKGKVVGLTEWGEVQVRYRRRIAQRVVTVKPEFLSLAGSREDDVPDELLDAAYEGDIPTLIALLEQGANVHALDCRWKVLFEAVEAGHTEVVRLLLDRGADVNATSWELADTSQTVLMAAAERGYTEVVSLLLARGADVNATDEAGWTALSCAVSRGHTEVVGLLKKAGAKE